MSPEVDDFLAAMMPRLNEAEIALHSGDPAPRFATWSHEDPVTVFGAVRTAVGWGEVGPLFEQLASSFSNFKSFENEIVAAGASGDLAYIAALERTSTSVNGAPPKDYVLRVTTVFRREGGEWKVVHRHADPASEAAVAMMQRLSSGLD